MLYVRIMDSMHIVRIMRIVRVVFEAIVAAETACSRHALGKDGYRVMDGFSNDELPRATRMRVRAQGRHGYRACCRLLDAYGRAFYSG
jgi:hypothetical protein